MSRIPNLLAIDERLRKAYEKLEIPHESNGADLRPEHVRVASCLISEAREDLREIAINLCDGRTS